MSLALLDWRRQVAEIYRDVRADVDPVRAHAQWRHRRDELFARHPESPLALDKRRAFQGLSYFPYDERFRFEVPVDVSLDPATISVETASDGTIGFRRVGRIQLDSLGDLDVWWLEGYGGGVFLPYADAGVHSYPGGRYVIDTVKGADLGGTSAASGGGGSLIVDLNFSYNPSCAYDSRWSCPLAPPGNRLRVAVEAGERYDT